MKNFATKFDEIKNQFERVEAKAQMIRESESKAEKKVFAKDHTFELSQLKKQLRTVKAQLGTDNKEKINPENRENIKTLLVWERQRKLLGAQESYLLNELEYEDILKEVGKKDSPWKTGVVRSTPPAAYYLNTGDEFIFRSDWDDIKGKNIMTFYVEVTKEPEDQITRELERKMKNNYVPGNDDFLPEKKLYKRFILVESEFKRYFIDSDFAG